MRPIRTRAILVLTLLSVVLAACGSAVTDTDLGDTAGLVATTMPGSATTVAPTTIPVATTSAAPTTSEVAAAHETIEVNSLELVYECQGSGSPAVVVAHGLLRGPQAGAYDPTWGGFRATLDALADLSTVCIYGRPGVGGSEARPENPQTTQLQADDLRLFANAVGIDEPMIVLGYSYGGLIAQLFAHQNPELVAGLLLVESSHPGQDERMGLEPPPPFPPERIDIPASTAEVSVVDDLGDLPLFVLTAADPQPLAPEALLLIWMELQKELAALSTDSKHQIVADTHHGSIPGRSADISAAAQDLIERVTADSSP